MDDLSFAPPETEPLVPGTDDFAYRPAAAAPVEDPGFLSRVGQAWMLGPSVQAMSRAVEWLQPTEEGFDPLAQPELKGREEWAPWLREAKSRAEFELMVQRYTENEGRQQVGALHGTLWSELAAGILAPENAVGFNFGVGRSALSGALRGTAANVVTSAPLIAATKALDPTADRGHELEELFYASVAGGIFGGVAGGLTGLGDAFHARVGGFARQMAVEQRAIDARNAPVVGDDGVARAAPAAPLAYQALPTPEGASPRGDIAPAWGLENLVSKGGILNPLQTAWGVLAGSPHRSLQDFAHRMGGDFGLLTRRNLDGEATPVSAFLLAGRHLALAAETERQFQRAYAKYLGKPSAAEITGLNVTTTGARLGGLVRRVIKRSRADGKLEYHEWLEAIFDAHKKDKLEVDLSRYVDSSPEAHASVLEGVNLTRDYFDAADREGTGLDFLPSPAGTQRRLEERFRRLDQTTARLGELQAKGGLSTREQAELVVLTEAAERQRSRIPERIRLSREYDRLLAAWIEGHAQGRDRATDPDLQAVHARLVELELEGIGQRRIGSQTEDAGGSLQTVSNPDTSVPPPGAAANAGPAAANDPEARGPGPREAAPLRIFTADETAFNPPTNEPGITVDKWEGRQLEPVRDGSPEAVARAVDDTIAALELDLPISIKPEARSKLYAGDPDALMWDDIDVSLTDPDVIGDLYLRAQMDLDTPGWAAILDQMRDDDGAPIEFIISSWVRTKTLADLKQAVTNGSGHRLVLPDYQTGQPMVADAFHGTTRTFDTFDPAKQGQGTGAESAKKGIFFARNPKTTEAYTADGLFTPESTVDLDAVADLDDGLFARGADDSPGFWVQEQLKILPDATAGEMSDLMTTAHIMEQMVRHAQADNIPMAEQWLTELAEMSATARSDRLQALVKELVGQVGAKRPEAVPNVHMTRIRMENPYVHDFKGEHYRETSYAEHMDRAKAAGHDGVVFTNTFDGGPQDVIYAVFSPDQIRWRFNPEDFAAKQSARKAMGMVGERPSMPGVANDNRVAAALLDHPVELRNPEGLLPDHERVTADNLNDELGGPDTDPFYLTRRWDHERVRADEAGLRAAFDRWHHDEGKPPLTEKQWASIRDAILTVQPSGQKMDTGEPVGGIFRLGRKLDIPNEYVRDFVERNVSNLIREYSHRFGAGLEVHRIFGDRDAEDAMTDALVQMIREHEGGSLEAILKDVDRNRGAMRYVRDQVLGDLHVQDPLTLTKVGVEALTSWTSTVALGKVVFSQLPELMRPLMTHGFVRNFQFMTDNLIGNTSGFKEASRDLRLRVGEAIDVAMGISGRRLMEFGDLTRPGSTMAHRTRAALDPFISFANGPWYIMNLLGPVTDLTKNYVMTMSSHYLVDDMRRLVAGRASQKTQQNLLALGLDRDTAEAILAEPLERSGRLNIANLGAWQDQVLANRFAAAVRGDVNRVISTASPQSKSALSQGFLQYDSGRRQWAMVRLPFQFMHWGLSAAQKISMSALQGRDANAMGGVAALIGMAYVSQWLKSDERSWDKTPIEERVFRAVDASGVLSIAGNLNTMIETGTQGTYGLRPAFGMEKPFERSPAGLAGPAVGNLAEMYRAFTDPEAEDWQRASAVRRAIPTNNLIYWDGLMKGVQKGILEPESLIP